jgi:uncharacterized protein YdhG (YjbR/CyaY superfamily)
VRIGGPTTEDRRPKTEDRRGSGAEKGGHGRGISVGSARRQAPRSEEGISYGLPAFRLDGRWLVWYGAAAKHCALYGLDGTGPELAGYDTGGKGTIRFSPDDPPPAALVAKLVKARIAKKASRPRRAG